MKFPYQIAIIAAVVCYAFVISSNSKVKQIVDPRLLSADAISLDETYSNIMPRDYVGPETCSECHEEEYAKWKQHPHHFMNQFPSKKSVMGDFNNVTLHVPGGKAVFSKNNGQYKMTTFRGAEKLREYHVTRTVGSVHMQAYIGKQVFGPEPRDHEIYQEHKLPFSFHFGVNRWLPTRFGNIYEEEELDEDGTVSIEGVTAQPAISLFSETCINCHNTFPYAYRIFAPPIVGFRDATVAAALDPLMNQLETERADLKLKKALKDPCCDSQSGCESSCDLQSFNRPRHPAEMVQMLQSLDSETELVSIGISCESCHLGGREHAIHQKQIRFLPSSKFTKLLQNETRNQLKPGRDHAPTLLGTCTQCHSGNGKCFPNSAGVGNSREALDMHAGFCTSQLSCVDCHDPHTKSGRLSGGRDLAKHVSICTTCHTQYADESAALAHSQHSKSADVNCLDCHMPRYTRGVSSLVRTHKISMPVEETMLKSGSANACNSCHLDKSMQWTIDELSRRYDRNFQPDQSWKSFDDLAKPAGEVWFESSESHLRLLAGESYSRSQLGKEKLARMIWGLNDRSRINRLFAAFSVSRFLTLSREEPLKHVDIVQSPKERERQIRRWLEALEQESTDNKSKLHDN